MTSLLALWRSVLPALRPLVLAVCALGVAYVAYMFLVDVPMYWQRWSDEGSRHQPVLGLWQGVVDTASRWVVTQRWADWRSEVVWMSVYFSVAVWASIGLIHVPLALEARRPRLIPLSLRSRRGLPARDLRPATFNAGSVRR